MEKIAEGTMGDYVAFLELILGQFINGEPYPFYLIGRFREPLYLFSGFAVLHAGDRLGTGKFRFMSS